jgi:acetyl-CoA carboxylase, biotin carboxylase subunit
MNKIKKILIVNRSEIASRINFTCQSLGIETTSIYAPEDKFASYIYETNKNHSLSGNGGSAYLNQDEIIKIALKEKVDAIHPGYGFLAENAQFAQRVIDAGIIWIGPNPQSISLMGNKIQAREIMQKAGVPVVPGFFIKHSEQEKAKIIAYKIGYPILLKDPLGGGGKAIRKVETESEFDNAFQRVISEAKKFTDSNQILLEKYIEKGKHVEIQVAGANKNFIHLYERECSIQRRHQKIIEETPCNFLNTKTLDKMYKAAILAARAVDYQNIGTIEFIVTQNEDFYFLEMNTRLQVEHCVTEQTIGLDLVALQIEIAQTNKLLFKQKDISQKGHAIECRIYSEDTENNFAPSTGTISCLNLPTGPFIRHDHNLQENQEVTPFFDPMLSKLVSFGQDRNSAIKNMIYALKQFNISGIKTNIKFLNKLLQTQDFLTGNIHTQMLNKDFLKNLSPKQNKNTEKQIATIAAKLFKQEQTQKTKASQPTSNWSNQKWQ